MGSIAATYSKRLRLVPILRSTFYTNIKASPLLALVLRCTCSAAMLQGMVRRGQTWHIRAGSTVPTQKWPEMLWASSILLHTNFRGNMHLERNATNNLTGLAVQRRAAVPWVGSNPAAGHLMCDDHLWFKWLKVRDLPLICRFDPGTYLTDESERTLYLPRRRSRQRTSPWLSTE